MILRRLIATVDTDTNADAPPKPCDYFDMIGGTSTSSLIGSEYEAFEAISLV